MFSKRRFLQVVGGGCGKKLFIGFLDRNWRRTSRDANGFHFTRRALCILPVTSIERFPDALPADSPIHPDRAAAFQIVPALIYVRTVFGMATPQDEHYADNLRWTRSATFSGIRNVT